MQGTESTIIILLMLVVVFILHRSIMGRVVRVLELIDVKLEALTLPLQERLASINAELEKIMATQSQVAAELASLTAQIGKIKGEINSKLQELSDAIANQGNASPEVEAALAALKSEVASADDLITDLPAPEPDPAPPTE